jgi:hypothetical protein
MGLGGSFFEFAIGFVIQPELPLVLPLPTSLHSPQPAGAQEDFGLLSTAQARTQYLLSSFRCDDVKVLLKIVRLTDFTQTPSTKTYPCQ